MGEHDQAVLHDEDAHGNIYDDGRTLDHPEFAPGAGAGAGDDVYNDTQVYRYSHGKLIPDTVHVRLRSFNVTEWESLYSSLFGTSNFRYLERSFEPVIDDRYQVVGHLGWIDGYDICVPYDTVRTGSKFWYILEKRRLGEWRQQLLDEADKFDRSPFRNSPFRAVTASSPPVRKPVPCVPPATRPIELKPTQWDDARRGPLKDGSVELKLQNNLNYFLRGGGKAFVGAGQPFDSDYASYLDLHPPMPDEGVWGRPNAPFSSGYRFLVLVSPDGFLQAVLGVQKIPPKMYGERVLSIAFEVIDIALTILMIIDIVTIPVALFRVGALVAREAAIRAVEVAIEREAKASLELAMKIAQAEARGVVLRGAMAGPKEAAKLATKAFWDAATVAPKQLSEAQVKYWTEWTAKRMRQLGIPERNIGCEVRKFRVGKPKKMIGEPSKLPGDSGTAFNPMGTERGSNLRNFVEDGVVHEGGISVHGSVFQPWKDFEIWNKAAIEDRIDAIIAHEWLEFNGLSHEMAVERFEQSTLNISKKAKEILAYMKTQLVP